MDLFSKYAQWKILGHLLMHPNSKFHIKQMGRILGISPATVSSTLKDLEQYDLVDKEVVAQAHLYYLNLENPAVTSLKEFYGLMLVSSEKPEAAFLDADPDMLSLALYGSYAKGNYDDMSDIDLLVISNSDKSKYLAVVKDLEERLKRTVSISVFKLHQWRGLAKKKDAFYESVVQEHVLLFGSGIR